MSVHLDTMDAEEIADLTLRTVVAHTRKTRVAAAQSERQSFWAELEIEVMA